jgi:DNA-directed RNA polymerase subunit RPC12/RpoP
MYTRLRQEFDGDRENVAGITDYETDQNLYEVHCRSCNKILFADAETFKAYNHALQQDLDSPYVCTDCGLEEAELVAER